MESNEFYNQFLTELRAIYWLSRRYLGAENQTNSLTYCEKVSQQFVVSCTLAVHSGHLFGGNSGSGVTYDVSNRKQHQFVMYRFESH